MQSAGKDPIQAEGALSLLEGVTDLYVAMGKRTLHFDLASNRPSDTELLRVMLGRSGTLRAPAIKTDGRLLVGYNTEILQEHLE